MGNIFSYVYWFPTQPKYTIILSKDLEDLLKKKGKSTIINNNNQITKNNENMTEELYKQYNLIKEDDDAVLGFLNDYLGFNSSMEPMEIDDKLVAYEEEKQITVTFKNKFAEELTSQSFNIQIDNLISIIEAALTQDMANAIKSILLALKETGYENLKSKKG